MSNSNSQIPSTSSNNRNNKKYVPLKDYIDMKENHQKKINKILSAMKSDKNTSMQKKIQSYKKRKIECVNKYKRCKGSSYTGTIFSETSDEYRIQCSNINDNCGLDVYVKKNHARPIFDLISECSDRLQLNSLLMNKLHMDSLYRSSNLSEQAEIDAYLPLVNNLKNDKDIYDKYMRLYDEIVRHKKFEEEENKLRQILDKDLEDIRELLQNGREVSDADMKEVMTIYKRSVYQNAHKLGNIYKPLRNVRVDRDSKKTITCVHYEHTSNKPEDLEIRI
jgi:hypothetical protein